MPVTVCDFNCRNKRYIIFNLTKSAGFMAEKQEISFNFRTINRTSVLILILLIRVDSEDIIFNGRQTPRDRKTFHLRNVGVEIVEYYFKLGPWNIDTRTECRIKTQKGRDQYSNPTTANSRRILNTDIIRKVNVPIHINGIALNVPARYICICLQKFCLNFRVGSE